MYFRQLRKGNKIYYFIRWYHEELERQIGKDITQTRKGLNGGWDYRIEDNKNNFKLNLLYE